MEGNAMPEVFNNYSTYYDLIYEDKNYEKECDYLDYLWNQHSEIPVKSVLDVGCGTSGHGILLAKRGFTVHGIDKSQKMIKIARERIKKEGLKLDIIREDITSFDSTKEYDTAISMFAVMGYLTSNNELLSAFHNIKRSIKKGGLFIFDVWYGPAVLNHGPAERLKISGQDNLKIYRFASPKIDSLNNIVQVDYLLLHPHKAKEIKESHRMRYFFVPELRLIAEMSGFEFLRVFTFLSKKDSPTFSSWNIICILKAK